MDFFQIGPIPSTALHPSYNHLLVILSYLMAVFASYVTLNMGDRLQMDSGNLSSKLWWLFGGAVAMGAGIWSMHFIAMLALIEPFNIIAFDPSLTVASFIIAIVMSGFALFLLRNREPKTLNLIFGGAILGLGIVSMHYTGMWAMTSNLTIRYIPSLFALSIFVAIIASEAALFLIHQSSKQNPFQKTLRILSVLVMGSAITGMHYTAMWAAVFIPKPDLLEVKTTIHPEELSFYVATATLLIMGIALVLSNFKRLIGILHKQNEELSAAKAVLEQKRTELSYFNKELQTLNAKLEDLVKERSQELRAAHDEAVLANRSKSRLLAALSHEIKTPLNTILGFSELLLEESDGGQLSIESRKFLNAIQSNCRSLAELLSNLLDLSRVESGKMTVLKEEIRLNDFVEEIYEKRLAYALKRRVSFFLHYDSNLPKNIYFDAKKLQQILNGFLHYALFKAKNHTVHFFVLRQKNLLTFKIVLEEIHLSPQERTQLFQFSDDEKISVPTEAQILQLILAEKFIEFLNGKMTINNEDGTSFIIQFPLEKDY